MEEYKRAMYGAIASYLRIEHGVEDIVAVTEIVETAEWRGGCETCGYQEGYVDIYYLDDEGRHREYRYGGTFSEFVSRITD